MKIFLVIIVLVSIVNGFTIEYDGLETEGLLLLANKRIARQAGTNEGSGDDLEKSADLEENKCVESTKDDDKIANCNSKELTGIPAKFKYDPTILSMNNNKILSLERKTFPSLAKLHTLELNENQISSIEKDAFENLPMLRELTLSKNNFSELDPETFKNIKELVSLSLSKNPIKLPEYTTFLEIESLKTLNMSNCDLKNIPNTAFEGLKNLEIIDLRNNPLKAEKPISTASFADLVNLKRLFLSIVISDELQKDICKDHKDLDICKAEDSCIKCASLSDNEDKKDDKDISDKTEDKQDNDEPIKSDSDNNQEASKDSMKTPQNSNDEVPPAFTDVKDNNENNPGAGKKNVDIQDGDLSEKTDTNNDNDKNNEIKSDTANNNEAKDDYVELKIVDEAKKEQKSDLNSRKIPQLPNPPESPENTNEENKGKENISNSADGKEAIEVAPKITNANEDPSSVNIASSVDTPTKSAGAPNSVNGTAIGVIIGVIIVMVAGILIKKNWSKIKRTYNSRNSATNSRTPATNNTPKLAEESVALKVSKGDENNPV